MSSAPSTDYVDCPPDELFDYMADTRCLEEWTYSLRGFTPTEEPGLWLAYDRLGSETKIFTRTVANRDAMTVDYHCAWDQGKHLWMIYLMRIVDAQVVFDKPGSVRAVDQLPSPVLRPQPRIRRPRRPSGRCGSATSGTCSAPAICSELKNLKAIAEYRHHNGLPVTPALDEMRNAMNEQRPVSLLDISTYLPGEPIGADYYAQFAESDDLRDNLMFRAPKFRHHVAEDETADRHGGAGHRRA